MKNTGALIALAALVWILLSDNKKTAGTPGVITVLPGQYYSPSTGLTDRYGNRVAM